MPIKDVDAFYEKVATDKSLQKKLKDLDTKAAAEFVKIAKDAGFTFTAADLLKARDQRNLVIEKKFAEIKKLHAPYRCCRAAMSVIEGHY